MIKGCVYILSNIRKTVIYIGATKDLKRRITLHKKGRAAKFTKKYKINRLLYFEEFSNLNNAFSREKQLKNWKREWKLNLIKMKNPNLEDLFDKLQ